VVRHALAWAGTVLDHRDAPAETVPALRDALSDALRDLPAARAMLDAAR
jgi:hypothetical protein